MVCLPDVGERQIADSEGLDLPESGPIAVRAAPERDADLID